MHTLPDDCDESKKIEALEARIEELEGQALEASEAGTVKEITEAFTVKDEESNQNDGE